MEQIRVSPLPPAALIIGKLVPYALISLISAHLVLALGWVLLGVAVKGNYFLLLLSIVLFLVCGLGQGILISAITRTQLVAFLISVLTAILPTFILSGFVFPVRNMPVAVQVVTYLIPAKYFLVALRAIILKGAGIAAFWRELLALALFAVSTLALSVKLLRRARRSA
jgi:ABC-2 type transport system permease protein